MTITPRVFRRLRDCRVKTMHNAQFTIHNGKKDVILNASEESR